MHEDEFTPQFRDPNDPELRAFSLRDQRILDAVHPRETTAQLLAIPLTILFFRHTAQLVKNRRPSRLVKGLGLAFFGSGTLVAAGVFATGMINMALVRRSPNYTQLHTYLDRHDGNDWRYKYWTSYMIDWWLGRKIWAWFKANQFHGRFNYAHERKYQEEMWDLERKNEAEGKRNLREEIEKLKEKKQRPPEGRDELP